MDDQRWYKDGLRFECTECGACCTGAPGFVWVNKSEIEGMAACLDMEVAEFETRYVRQVGIRKSLIERPNYDCVFLHGGRCDVYPVRPRQCRTWPFWESNLSSPERWNDAAEACPGCNHGKLFTLLEIEGRLSQLRV
jgi:uncharacterized protein